MTFYLLNDKKGLRFQMASVFRFLTVYRFPLAGKILFRPDAAGVSGARRRCVPAAAKRKIRRRGKVRRDVFKRAFDSKQLDMGMRTGGISRIARFGQKVSLTDLLTGTNVKVR